VTETLVKNSPSILNDNDNNVGNNNNGNNNADNNNVAVVAPAGAHLTDLSGRRMAIVRIWDAMFRGARSYVERHGFVGVHNMPEIVGVTGACENVDTLFKVDFFGKPAFLAQSDQLYLELLTPQLGRVYAEIQSPRQPRRADRPHQRHRPGIRPRSGGTLLRGARAVQPQPG
jgi:hypothetical protein